MYGDYCYRLIQKRSWVVMRMGGNWNGGNGNNGNGNKVLSWERVGMGMAMTSWE